MARHLARHLQRLALVRGDVVEFRTADGEVLSISIPRSEADVMKHFQERMPHGLFLPDDPSAVPWPFRR